MYGQLHEVFSSIQGEGIYIGVRQIFLRFNRCNLRCAYCDTQETIDGSRDFFLLETAPGSKNFLNVPNPVSPEDLLTVIQGLNPSLHHSLSLTGGEPLLHERFLEEFLPLFNRQCPVFLETNGTLCEELNRLLSHIDIISMDMKLPSVTGRDMWQKHEEFLEIARAKDVYVKVVLTGETTNEEIDRVIQTIKVIDRSIPLVLQPVTPAGKVQAVSPEKVLALQDRCSLSLNNVRVIPQMHKFIDQL